MGRVLNLVLYVQEQQVTKLKNEKLKIAMLKLKEASVQKVCTSYCTLILDILLCSVILNYSALDQCMLRGCRWC